MAFWGEGGAGRAGLHGIGGGLLGGVNGVEGAIKAAIGAGAGTILGPGIKKVVDAIVRESGLTGEDAKRLSDTITSGIIVGAITGAGGTDAGGYAGNELKYNYLSNHQLEELRLELEACDSILCSFSTEMKWTAISMGQDGSFTAGMVAGVPVELYDAVKGIVQMATNPGETYDALKSLFNSDDVLGQLSGALKESYIERIDRLKSEYERAGASGSFNAGVETGKLLTDLATLVTGVGAAVKGTTSVAGKVITKTVGKAALKDAQNAVKEAAKNAGKGTRNGLEWNSWQSYQKQNIGGRQYARIGDRLYSQHAVDRMQPSGLGSPAGTVGAGRNISPNIVEDVIKNGIKESSVSNGIKRTVYWSGDVGVVTERGGKVVVTILRRSGK